MPAMPTRFVSIVVDAADPHTLGHWWSGTLGWPVQFEDEHEVVVEPDGNELEERVPALVFVPVADTKVVKNRLHLDLSSDSAEHQRAAVEVLRARGATAVDIGQHGVPGIGQHDVPWIVMADPEGNEFCVLDPRDRYLGGGSLAAVVVDAADPAGLAAFWAEATGWSIGYEANAGEVVSLHSRHGGPPDIDFVRVDDPKIVKDRLHLDVRPFADDDQAAEVERLVALGARRIDVGQREVTWVVLADPEGNEFCVLRSKDPEPYSTGLVN